MKKLASLLVLVFAFTITTQAQKKRMKKHKEKLTSEQQATLAVKKMAISLELTAAQQRQVKPLVLAQINERRTAYEKMKKHKESKKELSADERYKMANAKLDSRLAFQRKMKSILNDAQFEKFKKLEKGRKRMMGKKMKRKKMMKKHKKHKERKEHKEEKN
jgi:uncharacterized coiled-coil protein SlyX